MAGLNKYARTHASNVVTSLGSSVNDSSGVLDRIYNQLTGDTIWEVTTNGSPTAGPTYNVAPSNASLNTRRRADVVLNGHDDQLAINSLLGTLGATGGTMEIMEGLIKTSDDILINADHITLKGQRGATYIQRSSGAARGGIVIGTAQVCQGIYLDGLTLDGNLSNSEGPSTGSTAIGILASMAGSRVYACDIRNYGGDNYYNQAWDGSSLVFENFVFDTFSRASGGAGFHIGSTVFNSEFIRCFVKGAGSASTISPNRGTYGFWHEGAAISYYHCHPYFCNSDGFHTESGAGSFKIIGGEYETNDGYGVITNNTEMATVIGSEFYANLAGAQLATTGAQAVTITGNRFSTLTGSANTKCIQISSAVRGTISDNDITGSGATKMTKAISIEGASSNITITDNRVVNIQGTPTGWVTGTVYAANAKIAPVPPNGHAYQTTAGLTSGVTQPTWTTGSGDSITDNGGTWTEIGLVPMSLAMTDATQCVVSGNTFDRGLAEIGSCDRNRIHNNNMVDSPFIISVGAKTKVRQNSGWITESSGTTNVLTGTTGTTAVAHGLAATPTHIMLTSKTSWGSAAKCWTSAVTSASFTLNVDANPGQTVTFHWIATVGEQ